MNQVKNKHLLPIVTLIDNNHKYKLKCYFNSNMHCPTHDIEYENTFTDHLAIAYIRSLSPSTAVWGRNYFYTQTEDAGPMIN